MACKKYTKSQKNGILLIKIKIGITITEKFYETKNFEVFCFCHIFKSERPNKMMILNKNKMIETEYFLVGGFEQNKKRGLIKLYKINYNNTNFDLTNIEYIQDIEIKKGNKFKGFKGPITCITQSKYDDGQLLITCFDGNVYLFSRPKIYIYCKWKQE